MSVTVRRTHALSLVGLACLAMGRGLPEAAGGVPWAGECVEQLWTTSMMRSRIPGPGFILHNSSLILFLLASLLLPLPAGADSIGWSTPRQLAPATAACLQQYGPSPAARDPSLWTLWFEEKDTSLSRSTLKASRFSNGSWSEPESVTSDTADFIFVQTAVDAALNPWAVWSRGRYISPDSGFSFCLWSRRQGDSWTSPELISRDTAGHGGSPSVTSDPVQGIWAIWHKIQDDSVSILSSYCRTDSWAPQAVVARFLWWFVPYVPVITAPSGGKVRSVWTGALPIGIGIYSATWSGDSWEDHELIPEGSLGYWPSVCSDSVGGTWVTWYDGFSGDSGLIRCAHHDGTGWTETWRLATGNVSVYRGMLCCDEQGWIWALWVQPHGTADGPDICVRYFDGDSWSDRSVVATPARMIICPRIAAALGRVWVTWTQCESDDRWLLYYSHTLPAGIAGHERQRLAAVRVSPSVVRAGTAIRLSGLQPGQTVQLLDATGRKVELRTRDLCTSLLSPGVYFVRISGRGQPVSHKVLVVQ